MDFLALQQLWVSLGLGLLMGLQRERSIGGIRSFPFIALFGTAGLDTAALLSGLIDMDAITLSTAQLAHSGAVAAFGLVFVAGGLIFSLLPG